MEYKFLSLIALVLLPLLPMLLILSPVFPNNAVIVRRFAKWFASLHFAYALLFLFQFNPDLLSMSFKQEILPFGISWVNTMGITATFAVDGLSMLLCVLTLFIFLIALIVSKYAITSKHKLYYSLIFLLETSLLGVFCAKDIFLFFLFWCLELIPMYFLISLWGKENASKTATKYLTYSSLGNMFLLFGLLILYCYNFAISGVLTANIEALSFDEYVSSIWFQIVTFIALFLGFAVKIPVVPFHTWLPDLHSDAPMPVNIITSSAILCMGAYGLIKFNMQMFPTTFKALAVYVMILAVVGIIYAALISFAQKNVSRLISYAIIAQGGFILLGLTSITEIGFTGAIFQIFARSLIFAGLFLLIGFIYLRIKTYDIEKLGGIGRTMPKLMYFALPFVLAATGVPLLIGFPAQLMAVVGMFTTELFEQVSFQLAAIAVIFALIFIASCLLRFLHKVFFANILSEFNKMKDITMSEFVALLMIIIPTVLFGCSPSLLIDYYNNVVSMLIDILRI